MFFLKWKQLFPAIKLH